jgi:hypothetical protein
MYIDSHSIAIEQHTLGIAPVVSLSAVSATGPGTALDGVVVRQNALMSVTTSAGVSAGRCRCKVALMEPTGSR